MWGNIYTDETNVLNTLCATQMLLIHKHRLRQRIIIQCGFVIV